jgi:hypothetical protein
MKPELHRVTTLTVVSIAALCLLATPLAIDRNTLAIDAAHAVAKGLGDVADGVGDSLGDAANSVGDNLGDAANSVGDSLGDAANSVGASVGNAADRVGDSVGDAADRVGDSGGDAADRVGDSVGDAADSVGDSIGDAADDVADSVGDTADDVADSVGTGVTVTVREFTKIRWRPLGDSVGDAAGSVGDSIGDAADDVADSVGDTADDVADRVGTGVTVIVREVTTIRWKPVRGSREAGDKHRLPIGPRKFPSTAVAAIEPSAGLAIPGCATDDGKEQDTEISCLIAGFEAETRQIAYAPPGATISGRSPGASAKSGPPAATLDGQLQPSISKLPSDPGLHDEIYGLQQVEARRYSDREVPVLVVQGLVSNMSNGQRSVPPLLAIVQDDQGKELMRWTFRAEAETLGPGASTGFRSEMFDPQSESAKVTIVFAPEQQTMQ